MKFNGIFNFLCDLDLDNNTAIQSFHKIIYLLMMCHQTKFSCKRISSSEDRKHILIINVILHCDLELDDSKQIFWKTIWLIMMHHHSKSGSKRFSDSEDIIWTFINILKFAVTLTLSTTFPFSIRHSQILVYDNEPSDQVW